MWISCSTSGVMSLDRMATTPPNLCLAGANAHVPSLPSQNPPIDFTQAAASKDSAHTRSKLDHHHLKLSLSPLSPGQHLYLQDSKSSAWDRKGIVVSMRPRRLLRPVVLESSPSPSPICPARVTPPILRRSERLQSRASSSTVSSHQLAQSGAYPGVSSPGSAQASSDAHSYPVVAYTASPPVA